MGEEVVSHVQGAGVPLLHREARIDGDGDFRFETVSHPPDADVGNRLDVRDGVGRQADLLRDVRVRLIDEPPDDRAARRPRDDTDDAGDAEPDDGIGLGEPKPYAGGAEKDREAGQGIHARVLAVGDKRGAGDATAGLDPDPRGRFVSGESDEGGRGDDPEMGDLPRFQETEDGFIGGQEGACGDDDDDGQARQVLYASVAVAEPTVRLPAGHPKGQP